MYSPLSNMFLAGIYEYLGNEKNFDIRFKLLVVHINSLRKIETSSYIFQHNPCFFRTGVG